MFDRHICTTTTQHNHVMLKPQAKARNIVFLAFITVLDVKSEITKDDISPQTDARSCVTCDKVLDELEKIDDDTDTFGVDFVKINDKRLAKQYGITKFPALTYFREKEPIIYDGW